MGVDVGRKDGSVDPLGSGRTFTLNTVVFVFSEREQQRALIRCGYFHKNTFKWNQKNPIYVCGLKK